MFIEKIKSDGLAHLSYLVGDGGEAAVVDPRRDCEGYVEMAAARGCRITHIFETHRNEDLVSGAPILAGLTRAQVHHGPNPAGDVLYADTVREGAEFRFGSLTLRVLETPGHTDDSLSFTIHDDEVGADPVGVLTGDALFVGDVGRTDFYPDRAEEVAGLLYDSLQKICALGDHVLVYPAHGAGSVCGNNMANREFTSVGFERRNNPMLQFASRKDFIAAKLAEHHDQPPYFRLMERLNLKGSAAAARVICPSALDIEAYRDIADACTVMDVRGIADYLGAHLPGSLAIPCDMVPAFAGWLVDPDDRIVLLATDESQAETAARHLARIGYDRVEGFLAVAMTGWASRGLPFGSIPVADVDEVARQVDSSPNDWTLLDVRKQPEIEDGIVPGAHTIFLGHLPEQLDTLDPEGSYTVMCASGARATIGASILRRAGFSDVRVFLGSMAAWKASGRKTVSPEST